MNQKSNMPVLDDESILDDDDGDRLMEYKLTWPGELHTATQGH